MRKKKDTELNPIDFLNNKIDEILTEMGPLPNRHEFAELERRVYALEHTPKFKRGDRVAIMERIPEYIGNRTMRVGKLTKIDTGTILYHTGNDGNQHLYNIDLDRGEIVLNYSESQLEPLSEVEPEKK